MINGVPAASPWGTLADPANTCLDSSGEWIVEGPAYPVSFGTQILPLADYQVTAFAQGRITSHNRLTNIRGFNGYVYNVQMTDDTGSYYLDCVGQTGPSSQLLLVSNASACPTVRRHRDQASRRPSTAATECFRHCRRPELNLSLFC